MEHTKHLLSAYLGGVISIEGIEFSGKTTIAKRLVRYLVDEVGLNAVYMRLPGQTPMGTEVRKILFEHASSEDRNPAVDATLFIPDFLDFVHREWMPTIEKGDKIIVLDRYMPISNFTVGVGTHGFDPQRMREVIGSGFLFCREDMDRMNLPFMDRSSFMALAEPKMELGPKPKNMPLRPDIVINLCCSREVLEERSLKNREDGNRFDDLVMSSLDASIRANSESFGTMSKFLNVVEQINGDIEADAVFHQAMTCLIKNANHSDFQNRREYYKQKEIDDNGKKGSETK